jgi:uncharacterized protein
VPAVYNLLNSAAALMGAYSILDALPPALPLWLAAVGIGGTVGAFIGSRYLPDNALRVILAIILLVAGVKLVAA